MNRQWRIYLWYLEINFLEFIIVYILIVIQTSNIWQEFHSVPFFSNPNWSILWTRFLTSFKTFWPFLLIGPTLVVFLLALPSCLNSSDDNRICRNLESWAWEGSLPALKATRMSTILSTVPRSSGPDEQLFGLKLWWAACFGNRGSRSSGWLEFQKQGR